MEIQNANVGNTQQQPSAPKPNENAGFNVSAFVKIIDLDTNEVLLSQKG